MSALRKFAPAYVVALCVLMSGLMFSAAPALASGEHVFSGSFGTPGAGPGQFSGPAGVAVNEETGDVYVVDKGNNRIEEFDSTGSTLLGEFNGAAAPSGALSAPEGIAVDNSTSPLDPSRGDVYVVDTGHDVVDKFSATGSYEGQLTKGAGGTAFGELDGVAVDPAGVVWVYQGSAEIDSYSNALGNEFVSSVLSPFGVSPGFAVDPEGNLYINRGLKVFAKLNPVGESLIEALDGEESTAAAVDPINDDVYVDNVGTVAEFNSQGTLVNRFGAGHLTAGDGLAVNAATQTVYVADAGASTVAVFTDPYPIVTTKPATSLQVEGSATLNGTVNPLGALVTFCEFQYGTSTAYTQTAPCSPATPSGSGPVAVHADLSGLTPGVTYHFRLVAENELGGELGQDVTFFTPAPPRITGETASDVASASATLNARINPDTLDTTYRFEWGSTTAYGTSVPVPDADIGAGTNNVRLSTHLSELSADTTYHWRVVAHNADGTSTSADHTFLYDTGGPGLPDNRAYEMVTPPRKNAGQIGGIFLGVPPDVSEDGRSVIMASIQCLAGSGACTASRGTQGEPYLFTRESGGWDTTPLAPPATRFGANASFLASADAKTTLFSVATEPAGEDDWLARGADGSFTDVGPVTAPAAGPASTEYWGGEEHTATSDLSHVVWASRRPLWPFDLTIGAQVDTAYEYVGNGNVAPALLGVSGGRGGTDLISRCGIRFGHGNGEIPGSLSADGRTVFFTALACPAESNAGVTVPANELWARIDESRSVLLSGRSPSECTGACSGSPAGDAQFQGASAGGSQAFFTSTQQLTDNASEDSQSGDSAAESGCLTATGVNGCNLYLYDFTNPAGENLIDVSAGDTSGHGPRVQGVMEVSSDGSHAYFVARGVLSAAANGQGQVARDGAENLYVFDRDATHPAGDVEFIATLPESDREEWEGQLPEANVTPDGRFLVFTSHGDLTADDSSASGAAQVFRYDAVTGALVRISVGDHGFGDNGNRSGATPCTPIGECSESASIARPEIYHAGPARLDTTMSRDGSRVFFQSPVALAPGALDDVQVGSDEGIPTYAQNVYEYHDGRVYLISDGRDIGQHGLVSDVKLLGSDATGANVFFTTSDRLVGQDTDTQLDVYDARICTAGDPCVSAASLPLVCQGEACHGVPGAALPAPGVGTATFSGPGNLAAPPVVAPKKAVVKKHGKAKRRRKRTVKKKRAKGHKAARRGVHTSKRGRS